ncbi:MAG: hypothetical protein AAF514_06510 [Verrucomicrobiota bacterium]
MTATNVLTHLRGLYTSPTRERDMVAIFSPVRIAGWFLILNLVIIAGAALFFVFLQQVADDVSWIAGLGLGKMLAGVIFLSLGAFLTIFIPIRILGFLMGPRSNRYFDQIVISGISPIRYFIGKVIAQNAFFLVTLAATIPYFILALSLGGFEIGYVLSGILLLWLHVNVLSFVSLALSIMTYEIWSLILVLLAFAFAFGFGFGPWNPNPLLITPSQVLISPLWEQAQDLHFHHLEAFPFLSLQQSQFLLYTLISLVLIAGCFVYLLIGPPNCITRATSTFGEVVMPGDNKRRGFLKKRAGLRLRSEIAFFYENCHDRIRQRDFLLRWGMKEGLFFAALTLTFFLFILRGAYFNQRDFLQEAVLPVSVIACLINVLLLSQTTGSERLKQRRLEAGTIDWLWFGTNILLILTGFFLVPWIRDTLSLGPGYQRSTARVGPANFLGCGAILTSAAFCLSAMFRWVSLRFWDKATITVITFTQYAFLFLCCPLILYGVFTNLTRIARLENQASAEIFSGLSLAGFLSPILAILPWAGETLQNNLHSMRFEGALICCLAHLLVGLFFFNCYRRRRRTLPVRTLS